MGWKGQMHLVLKFPYFQLIKGSLGIMTFFIALSLIFDAFMCLGFK